MAKIILPALHKNLIARTNADVLRQVRDTAADDGVLSYARSSIEALTPVELNGHDLVRLRLWFLGTAKGATIGILTAPKGGGLAELLWYGAVSSGVAMPSGTHPITGDSDAGDWFEIDISTATFSRGPDAIEEHPLPGSEVAGYPKAFVVRTDGADLLAIHIDNPTARVIVGVQAF